eukprot:scaffold556_cov62-Phaeocystis_antarctica.AAC.4
MARARTRCFRSCRGACLACFFRRGRSLPSTSLSPPIVVCCISSLARIAAAPGGSTKSTAIGVGAPPLSWGGGGAPLASPLLGAARAWGAGCARTCSSSVVASSTPPPAGPPAGRSTAVGSAGGAASWPAGRCLRAAGGRPSSGALSLALGSAPSSSSSASLVSSRSARASASMHMASAAST